MGDTVINFDTQLRSTQVSWDRYDMMMFVVNCIITYIVIIFLSWFYTIYLIPIYNEEIAYNILFINAIFSGLCAVWFISTKIAFTILVANYCNTLINYPITHYLITMVIIALNLQYYSLFYVAQYVVITNTTIS